MTSPSLSAKPVRMIVGWIWSDGFSPEELRYGAIISVWVRWFWVIGGLMEINYSAGCQDHYYALNTLYVPTPGLINGTSITRSGPEVPCRPWTCSSRPSAPPCPAGLRATSTRCICLSLEATGKLARSAMWSLRHSIDVGVIFDGQGLVTTLSSHAATFTAITSIPAEVTQLGSEPPLSVGTKSMLFSIAHNAMTNVFRHAGASRVDLWLDFESDRLRLWVSDDGKGLPEDYARRGHGFRNMRADAERLGGSLCVKDNGGGPGTTVVCLIPFEAGQGGF